MAAVSPAIGMFCSRISTLSGKVCDMAAKSPAMGKFRNRIPALSGKACDMAAKSPAMGKFCPSRLGGSARIGFAHIAIFIRANSACCIRAGRLNVPRTKAGRGSLLARRIGVRAQFDDAQLATSKALGRIGIRPQICYTAPVFGAGAKEGQWMSGDFRDANWPLRGGLKLAQQVAAAIDLFVTQIGFQYHFQCAQVVADLGSDPNSARDFEISDRCLPELGSDPNSAGHPDSASVSAAQRSDRLAMKANAVQVSAAIYFVSGGACCIRAGRLNVPRTKAGRGSLLARRIGVRAQFDDAQLATSKALGRIGIRPQICYTAPVFGAGAKEGQWMSGDFRDANWPLRGGLKLAQQVAAAIDLFVTQIGFQYHFQCAQVVADLGSDPNSARDFEISDRCLPELGSDPNSAGHPDSASVSAAQRSDRLAMKANAVQVSAAIYFVSGGACCIRAGRLNDHRTKAGCGSLLARRIGVRAQFGDAQLVTSRTLGRIGIRPQICYAAPVFGAGAKAVPSLPDNSRGATKCLSARLKLARQADAADRLSKPVQGSYTPTQQATS